MIMTTTNYVLVNRCNNPYFYQLNGLSEKHKIKNYIVNVSIFLAASFRIDTIRAFSCIMCAFYPSGMCVFQLNTSACDANACDANAHIRIVSHVSAFRIRRARFRIRYLCVFVYVMRDAKRAHAIRMCIFGNL